MSGPLLQVRGLNARYGRVEVVHSLELDVCVAEAVGLLGPNGAGKTTSLCAISRTVKTSGQLMFDGRDLSRDDPAAAADMGIGHVPQGRGTFNELTVLENLRLGSMGGRRRDRRARRADIDRMMSAFPALAGVRDRQAGLLSGGQQQMLALARALVGRPRLLLVDEPSLGLAPGIVADLLATLRSLQREWGLAILLAEQNARVAVRFASRAVLLAAGRVVWQGATESLDAELLRNSYIGVDESSRR